MQTLKNKKQPNKRAFWLVTAGVAVLIVILYALSAHALSWWPFMIQNTQSSSSIDKSHQNMSATKSAGVKSPADKVPKQYDTPKDSSQTSNSLTGTINYSSVVDGTLVIRATINQSPSNGSCQLTLTNKSTGRTIVKSADIVANPSSSTCNGFDIPVSQLSSGSWSITINLTSGDSSGQITGSAEI